MATRRRGGRPVEPGATTRRLTAKRAAHEDLKIEERRLRILQLRGALIPVAEVARGQFDFARRLRDRLLGLPGRYTPVMAAQLQCDPRRLHLMFEDALREQLEELADELRKGAQAADGTACTAAGQG